MNQYNKNSRPSRQAGSSRSGRSHYTKQSSRGRSSSSARNNRAPSYQSRSTSSQRRSTAPSRQPAYTRGHQGNINQSYRRGAASHNRAHMHQKKQSRSIFSTLLSNTIVRFVLIIFVLVGAFCIFDGITTANKTYNNIEIEGINVSGKTSAEISDLLHSNFDGKVAHKQITVLSPLSDEETQKDAEAVAEQLSYDDAQSTQASWSTDALSLKAHVLYDDAINKAMNVGRVGSPLIDRFLLLIRPVKIPLEITYDEGLLDEFASKIDDAIGDARSDTTIEIEDNKAVVFEGHSGNLVDRSWLAHMISESLLDKQEPDFVAQTSKADSRISYAEAEHLANKINSIIDNGIQYHYEDETWSPYKSALANWFTIKIVKHNDTYSLDAKIDRSKALLQIMENLDFSFSSSNAQIRFEDHDGAITVNCNSSLEIPDLMPSIEVVNSYLADKGALPLDSQLEFRLNKTSLPQQMPLDEAIQVGLVTTIGTFTTNFTNIAGTENRNHNIKLAAESLGNHIIEGNGGTWSFNSILGDTNEEAGYWTAGSIVDGEYVDSVGGGVCQVATTIFNAVMEAGLDVLQRHNHSLYISSYPAGRDAAVDYPTGMDLRWKNSLKSDVLLLMSYTDTSLTATILSVDNGYSVSYSTGEWEEGKKYITTFQKDDSLGDNAYYKKVVGVDGSKITIKRTVKDADGDVIINDAYTSIYDPKNEVYVIGKDVDTSKLTRKKTDNT